MIRESWVRLLVEAGFAGMGTIADKTTSGEVMSACMTMALRSIQVAKDAGADLEPFRDGIGLLYAELPPLTNLN